MSYRFTFLAVAFLTASNVLVWSFLGIERAYANRVYPGVWVQAQPLAGLTREQAIDRLMPINEAMLLQKVTLLIGDQIYQPTLAQLGYQVDTAAMADNALELGRGPSIQQIVTSILDYRKIGTIPILWDIDREKFNNYLTIVSQDVAKEPKNIALSYQDGNLIITPAEEGITIDKDELRQAIQQQARPGEPATIRLSVTKVAPELTNESQIRTAKEQLLKILLKPLTLQAQEQNFELTPATIYSFVTYKPVDSRLTIEFDTAKIKAELATLAKKVDIATVNKEVSAVNNEVLKEGQDGRILDIEDTAKRVAERLNLADFESTVVLKVNKIDRKTIVISPEFQTGRFPGRYLEIDLSAQRLHLIEGDAYHKTFLISTGKWSAPTPIGTFEILNHISVAWSKRYKLFMPNWMAIRPENGSYDGYGVHGLPYWPNGKREGENHLGRPVSHGCIRLGTEEIKYVYEWAQNGTKVIIHQ